MAYHERVVGDEVLPDPGWAVALDEDGDSYFVVRESAATDETVLADAREALRSLEV